MSGQQVEAVVAVAVVAVLVVAFVVLMANSRRISAHLAEQYRREQERLRRERERAEFEAACRRLGEAFDNLAHAFTVSFTPAIVAMADAMNGLADSLAVGRQPLFATPPEAGSAPRGVQA